MVNYLLVLLQVGFSFHMLSLPTTGGLLFPCAIDMGIIKIMASLGGYIKIILIKLVAQDLTHSKLSGNQCQTLLLLIFPRSHLFNRHI